MAQGQAEWRPSHHPWLVTISVLLATFMEVLDTSIANVALPHIAGNLSATVDESSWVLTSYLVSNAIILIAAGWMSSIFGRKRYLAFSVALFTISSALCGMAQSLPQLVWARVLQGLGGGGLQPLAQAVLPHHAIAVQHDFDHFRIVETAADDGPELLAHGRDQAPLNLSTR